MEVVIQSKVRRWSNFADAVDKQSLSNPPNTYAQQEESCLSVLLAADPGWRALSSIGDDDSAELTKAIFVTATFHSPRLRY